MVVYASGLSVHICRGDLPSVQVVHHAPIFLDVDLHFVYHCRGVPTANVPGAIVNIDTGNPSTASRQLGTLHHAQIRTCWDVLWFDHLINLDDGMQPALCQLLHSIICHIKVLWCCVLRSVFVLHSGQAVAS